MADSVLLDLNGGTPLAVLADADALYVEDNSDSLAKYMIASVLKTYVSATPTLVTPILGGALDGGGYDLNNLGVVFMTEQASAEANIAGKGQIFVLTAAPNLLKFDDDAGTTFGVLMDAGNIPLTADWDIGAFMLTMEQLTVDIATGTTPLIVASTTLVSNLNVDQVDGKDSTDFCLLDGSQELTANWDVGPYTVKGTQFISDIAGGTAPLVVTSTTVVPNLNVDQVDGKDSTDFCLLDGTQPLTADWDAGSFDITAEQFHSDITTGTSPFTVASTTVVTNLNADQVDGKEATDLVLVDGSQALTSSWDVGAFDLRSLSSQWDAGSAAGAVAQRFGTDATEGYEIIVVDETKSGLSAISTDLTADIPDGAYIISVQANIEAAITGGGTSVKVGIGPVASPSKYGLTSNLTQNQKIDTIPTHAILSGAEDVQINMCTTGGAIGDTVASGGGAVRVRIVYALPNSLVDA